MLFSGDLQCLFWNFQPDKVWLVEDWALDPLGCQPLRRIIMNHHESSCVPSANMCKSYLNGL